MKKPYHRRKHSVSLVIGHFVFCTKYRRVVITDRVFATIEAVAKRVAKDLEAELISINAEGNHVHVVIRYPPTVSPGTVMKRIKGATSRAVRKSKFGEVLARLYGKHLWSPSYFVSSCGGAPIEKLLKYVTNQGPRPTPERIAAMRKAHAASRLGSSHAKARGTPEGMNSRDSFFFLLTKRKTPRK